MTITEAQTIIDQWITTYGVRYFNELTNMTVLTEEVGELARLMSRVYGEQSFKNREDKLLAPQKIAEEMADILFVLLCLANQMDIDLEKALRKSVEKKTARDSSRHLDNKNSRMLKRFWEQASFTGKFGFVIIFLAIVCSLFAYYIIPDYSSNANNQNPELSLLPPMSKVNILEIKGNGHTSLLNGYQGSFKTLPYLEIQKISPAGVLQYKNTGGQNKVYQDDLLTQYHSVDQIRALSKQRTYWFGTDRYGRDILSRLILGIRISLLAGLIAVFIATVLGVVIGLFSGYFGGWVDAITMFFINSLWAFPTILFVFAIVMAFGRSLSVIFIAVGCTLWIDVARLVRGQTLKVKEEVYIKAAKSYGASSLRIIFGHILPNILGPLLVLTAANFAIAILIEAGLSYLGFGVSPPIPSLGNMLNENYGFALSGLVFMAVIPAIFIMLLVLSFNFLSQSMRDFLEN